MKVMSIGGYYLWRGTPHALHIAAGMSIARSLFTPILAPQELADGLVGQGGAVGGTSEEGDATGSGGTAPADDSGVTGRGKSPER